MIQHIPKLLEKYTQHFYYQGDEILEIVLNLTDKNELIFIECFGAFCQTNKWYKNTVVKQFHAFRSSREDQWSRKKAGCRCVDFKELNEEDLEDVWFNQVEIKTPHYGFNLMPAGSRC